MSSVGMIHFVLSNFAGFDPSNLTVLLSLTLSGRILGAAHQLPDYVI